ncbi:MAG: DEAD/DEAH box helicase [Gemmatimonadetes bacterium]|nr:DEAD/DEAH box helicase [Gemmatimonadota bacterium]
MQPLNSPLLFERIPAGRRAEDEELLDLFFDWTAELGLELYPAQEEAILEVMSGNHVIVNTPTGSGKSLVAIAAHFWCAARNHRSYYTAPIKALVNEKFFDLCRHFGGENVGMLTGDASINSDAAIICCTAEIVSNMALRQGSRAPIDYVVMDEFHYYGDVDRGVAWQIPLLALPETTFMLMSATLGDTASITSHIEKRSGRSVSVVKSVGRPVPLSFSYSEIPIHHTVKGLLEQDRAPIYLVNFSQKQAAEQAQNLTSIDLCPKAEKRALADAMRGFAFDSSYGKTLRRFLSHGVGLHHAGILPKYRLLVEKLAQKGLLKIVSGTDTLGVGVNIPIRTVLFTRLCKYDGYKVRILSVRDFQQIAGRAGRKGFDDQGWVVCQAPEHVIENRMAEAKAVDSGGKKRKFKKKQAPKLGFVGWDENTFRRLERGTPETLRSRFKVDHAMLLNLLQRDQHDTARGGGYRALIELIERSHERPAHKPRLRREGKTHFEALRRAELVDLVSRRDERGQDVMVSQEIQDDFSIFHTLSLYLLEAVAVLDESDTDYGVDLLTLVESVIEHPGAILRQQVSRLKGDRVAELKAQGVEYERRMEELEKVTYPKPSEQFIYATFNAFAAHHPWVGAENIKPKSIAREMYEGYYSFRDYTTHYKLERMEGTLLRYLSQCYKTLIQSVPDRDKNEAVNEVIGFLRATLERADSSLSQEWERMVGGAPSADEGAPTELPPDLSRDRKLFEARIRAELHGIVRALSLRDYEEAVRCCRRRDEGEETWAPADFEEALAPFFEEFGELRCDHQARLADKTRIREIGEHRWEVQQVLVDPLDENVWLLEGFVDLAGDHAPEGPIIEIDRIR